LTVHARSILFVCKANMCRSPSAEAVLRAILMERGAGASFDVDSAGTHDFGASPAPHVPAVQAARRRGYDVPGRKSRRITPMDFDRFDMILAMDRANVADLRRIAPTRCKQKIELLLEYGDRYYGQDVPDPVGGDARRFDLALEMIEDGCRGLAQLLLRAA
jgi:protein-tyrosine phosphatase